MNNELNTFPKMSYAYFPDYSKVWARIKFRELVNHSRGLRQALDKAGFDGTIITPKIRKIFYEYLGEP